MRKLVRDAPSATRLPEGVNIVHTIVLLSSIGTVLEPKPVIAARIAARDDVCHRPGWGSPTCAPTH